MPRPLVLLTGATGLAGGRALRALCARGARVRALVRRASRARLAAELAALPDAARAVDLREGDLDDPGTLAGACRGVDHVLHAAAALDGDEAAVLRTNAGGTEALVREARAAGVARFVLVGSVAVYRDGPLVRAREDAPRGGGSAYARSKQAAEDLVLGAGFPAAVVLRAPALVGPGDRRFAPALAHAVRAHALPTTRDGGARIDALAAGDLARALLRALEVPLDAPRAWNVAGPAPVRSGALIRAAARALGVEACLIEVPDDLARDPDDARWRAAAARATRTPLPWASVPAALVERTVDDRAGRAALAWAPEIDVLESVIASLRLG